MVDKLTPEARSENMRRIRSTNTGPELLVRRFLHRAGLRYRLHPRGMPGRPDIVFPARRLCVFVHGCFWHGCPSCIDGTRAVRSNSRFWTAKVSGNRARDERHRAALEGDGWRVLVIWECETRDARRLDQLERDIRRSATRPPPRTRTDRAGAPRAARRAAAA